MNWTIDKTARESAYRQLYRQIRGDIISGKLPRGTSRHTPIVWRTLTPESSRFCSTYRNNRARRALA